MAVVRLSGGLGNQLFQVSLAISISMTTNARVGIDLDNYNYLDKRRNRKPEILNFESEFFDFCNSSSRFIQKTSGFWPELILDKARQSRERLIRKTDTPFGLSPQIEGNLIFDSKIDLSQNSYFIGNYITPQYWNPNIQSVLEEVRRLIWKNEEGNGESANDRLILHIRRGDYVTNPKARNFHGICTDDYYLESTSKLIEEFPNIKEIVIFSDDKAYAFRMASLIKTHSRMIRVDESVDPINTLKAMCFSKYFIGANSTFSWWSSALMQDRVSILPAQWFLDPSLQIAPNNFFLGEVRASQMSLG